CRCGRRLAPALIISRVASVGGASSRNWSAVWQQARAGICTPIRQMRGNDMPRRLENDRWLFVVTLGLCLLGAVMIFSASAVTAEHEYGHSYIFLLRQTVWLVIGLAGMFVLVRANYRPPREAAGGYCAMCLVGSRLVGGFCSK